MNPHKRAFKIFPLSNTGVAYIACGTGLFFSGMIRGELVSSICGCAILLYALFCLVCAAVGAWRWKESRFSLLWEGKDIAALKQAGTIRMPERGCFFAAAFYESTFSVYPESVYVAPFKLSLPVSGPDTRHQIAIPPRGIYFPDRASIVIKDFSAFFKFTLLMPESMNPEPLRVLPETDETASIPLPSGRTGISQGKSTFHRSDELYETRPYMPGDDPRKINWKVSAHTGTPILREGELLPPPSTEYLFIFNTEIVDRKFNHETIKKNFDLIASRAAYIARSLAAQNKIISVATLDSHGLSNIATISPNDPDAKEALLVAFAEPQPKQPDPSLRTEPGSSNDGDFFDRNVAVLVFTMPENAEVPNLESLSKNSTLIVCGPASTSVRDKAKLKTLCSRFSSGGFNVAQI